MSTFLIALSVSVFPAQRSNMHMASYAIKAADKIVAATPLDDIYWKYADRDGPAKDASAAERSKYKSAKKQHADLLNAVRAAGSFAKPIRMSLVIKSAKQDESGRVHLDGTFQAYALMVDQYRTKQEEELIDAYEDETRALIAAFDARMAAETIPMAEQRTHQRKINNREAEFERWSEELDLVSQPRKDHLEIVKVSMVIPAEMADTIKVPELLKSKRVLITMKVEQFDVKAPVKELNEPARIGRMSGLVTDIVHYMKKG